MRRVHRFDERGLTSVELAVVFPGVLLLFATAMHFAMLFLAGHVVDDMANTALSTASGQGATTGDAERDALDVAVQEGFVQHPAVSVTRNASTVRVTVTARSKRLVPGLPDTLTRTIEGPVERFVAEADR